MFHFSNFAVIGMASLGFSENDRKREVSYLVALYRRCRTRERRQVVRERLLALALMDNPQRSMAIAQLQCIGVHVAHTPFGVTIGMQVTS